MSAPPGFDVAVVGGGLIGTALGYELTRAGARTVVVDRHDPGRATDAGAGILSPETMSVEDPAWFELATAAGEHYRTLVPELEDGGAHDTGYAATGALRIAFREWEDELFRDNIALARSRYGVAVEELSPEQARELFPPLGEIRAAWHSRRAARVDGRSMTAALLGAALEVGLTVVDGSVEELVTAADRVTGLTVAGEVVE